MKIPGCGPELKFQIPQFGACIDNWLNAKFPVKVVGGKKMNSHSQHAWTQSPWGPRASRSRIPVPTASWRSHFKERITLKTMSFHGDDCSLQLGFIAHPRRLCLAEWMSTKRANASWAWCSWSLHPLLYEQEIGGCAVPLIWCPTWKKIVTGTEPARGNGNMIPLTSSKKNSYCHRPEMLNICRIGEKYIC